MASIPSTKLSEIACDVAVKSRLPWRVEQLRTRALEVYIATERRAASLGLPSEQASESMVRRICSAVMKAGKGMDALPPGEQKPTSEQIETALEAFSTEQWITLLDGLERVDTEALLSYIRQNGQELKQRLGARKVEAIEGRAIMRDTNLWLRDNRSTLVPISDVYWALAWRDLSRQANCEGRGHSVSGRSTAEQASARNIARRLTKRDERIGRDLKVSAYEVEQWWKRAEQLPFEQYAAEVGADDEEKRAAAFIDYWAMIRKKHQRKT